MTTATKDKHQRLTEANELVEVIASCGRKFFRYEDRVSRFEYHNGRLKFRDKYSNRLIDVAQPGPWRGFTDGGTMLRLVRALANYIYIGCVINPFNLGPWPEWYGDGDPWAYGEAMEIVRAEASRLGITAAEVAQ